MRVSLERLLGKLFLFLEKRCQDPLDIVSHAMLERLQPPCHSEGLRPVDGSLSHGDQFTNPGAVLSLDFIM